MTHYQHIRLELDGPIAALVLNRAENYNAMTETMADEVESAVRRLNEATHVRVVLLRGEGRVFSAGGDFAFIEARTQDSPARNEAIMGSFYRRFLSILDLRMPSIAVIQGAAMGAGLCFSLAADLRVASDDATFAANFVRIGLHPGMGATYLLTRAVGREHAVDMLMTGRKVDAVWAERTGLVHRIAPAAQLETEARELARQIATAGPLAVAAVKRTLRGAAERTLEDALRLEAHEQARSYANDELAEGIRAFREKRVPKF